MEDQNHQGRALPLLLPCSTAECPLQMMPDIFASWQRKYVNRVQFHYHKAWERDRFGAERKSLITGMPGVSVIGFSIAFALYTCLMKSLKTFEIDRILHDFKF